jgi:GT2 family glycosyltransferase
MSDLTCAVVHWNVPALLAECLETLLQEVEAVEATGTRIEVLVVDNASRPDARERVRRETPGRVRILWSEENLGYPRACNLAYEAASSPLVLLSNPDVVYLPGSLAALAAAMEDRSVAFAGPATWWDRERTLKLNPGYPEDRARIEADAAAARDGSWPAHALAWQRRMSELTFASAPRPAEILSGACFVVRKRPVDAAGGLFDPALFLYYDDTDLCLRLRERSLPVVYDVADHMAASRHHFLARHYGEAEAERLLGLAAAAWPGEAPFASAWDLCDLGTLDAPPTLSWSADGPSELAVGLNPQVVPAALARLDRPSYEVGAGLWDQLTPGPYYARATDPAARGVLGYWKLTRR